MFRIATPLREEDSTSGSYINFDRRQETSGAAFPTVNLPFTPTFLRETRRNLAGFIGSVALALCIGPRMLAVCMRVGLFRDVVPAVVVLLRDQKSGFLED